MPYHLQQSVPGLHELSFPDGSDVIPDLKASRPNSSSAWHVAAVTVRHERVEKRKRERMKK